MKVTIFPTRIKKHAKKEETLEAKSSSILKYGVTQFSNAAG